MFGKGSTIGGIISGYSKMGDLSKYGSELGTLANITRKQTCVVQVLNFDKYPFRHRCSNPGAKLLQAFQSCVKTYEDCTQHQSTTLGVFSPYHFDIKILPTGWQLLLEGLGIWNLKYVGAIIQYNPSSHKPASGCSWFAAYFPGLCFICDEAVEHRSKILCTCCAEKTQD